MTRAARILYNGLVVPAARLARPVAARLSPKLRAGIASREGALDRWAAAAGRAGARAPRVWLHAASAGETLQARPLAAGVRRVRPGAAVFYSFFSPSAARYVEGWDVPDHADYLPFDTPGRMRRMVETLRPDVLVLIGAELWPNLVWQATDRGIAVAQACCRFGEGAGRLRWPVRSLTADLYRRLSAVGAVAEDDAAILRGLGVSPDRVAVTGDTRVDVTLARVEAARAEPPSWRPPAGAGPVVVAGSTWPADERIVLPAVARLAGAHPDLVAFLAPHEPGPDALARLEAAGSERGFALARLSALEAGRGPTGRRGSGAGGPLLVLVDRVGVLYRLYALADVGYVGGGFGGSVHNTMEPAAWGVPVAIGPAHGAPHEVVALERVGALAVVGTPDALAAAWEGWLAGPEAGRAARAALEDLAGAADRTLGFLRDRGLPL